jgi:excinuclease UvrABC helicase subunit UvrB
MNLDAKINMVGFEIANILDENIINKLLGVLANDGVYAMWVYAINKLKDTELLKFLKELSILPINIYTLKNYQFKNAINEIENERNKKQRKIKFSQKVKELDEFFQTLSQDLNQLLFFKEMLEKALIYARYHAKAMGDE